jgi:hypothetical protein
MGIIVDGLWDSLSEHGKASFKFYHENEYDVLKWELLEYAEDEGVLLDFKVSGDKVYVYLVDRVRKAKRDRAYRSATSWRRRG